MTKAYKSLGCEADLCPRQHYAGGLCRKHYQSSKAVHPAALAQARNTAKVEALLLENITLGFQVEELEADKRELVAEYARCVSIIKQAGLGAQLAHKCSK